jgi:hypothetical protein
MRFSIRQMRRWRSIDTTAAPTASVDAGDLAGVDST